MKLDFRRLLPDEIQAKVKVETQTSVMLLLYKDARVDMAILDETVGKMNWQRHHVGVNNNMFCVVDIWDDDKKCWVSKSDAGSESQTEKEKGESSDSFKRACVNWGIGRELYTSPPIWVNVSDSDYSQGQKRRLKTVFSVADIEYDDRGNIIYLILEDQKGLNRFTYGKKHGKEVPKKKPLVEIPEVIADSLPDVPGEIPYDPKDAYNRLCNIKPKEQVNALLKAERIGNFSEITPNIYKDLLLKLGRMKPTDNDGLLDGETIPFGG